MNIIRSLAYTIDAKDRYTSGHSQRVADYSLAIAKRMGKSEEDQKIIYPQTVYHRGKEVEGQKGLIGIWEGLNDGSSFVFTPAGYFLEDNSFSGNYMINEEEGTFLLHYGDVFADTLCYYSIDSSDILTVEYPWPISKVR